MRHRATSMHRFLPALLILVPVASALAEVRLPNVLGDNMVLQRGLPVPIWGSASPNEKVTVTFAAWTKTAIADAQGRHWRVTPQTKTGVADAQGKWKVVLDPLAANDKPAELTVTGDGAAGKVVVKNVLVGEVWIASGQSNMFLEMKSLAPRHQKRLDEALAQADCPALRLMLVNKGGSGAWQPSNRHSALMFSACAYFFARDLHKELKVPVGIIAASVGGSFIESWAPSLKGDLYRKMVLPVVPFALRGAIWYQGEANTCQGDGMKYVAKQKALIEDWRKAWGREISFYYVQICPCDFPQYRGDSLPLLWQAQRACLSIPKTGMAVTTDCVSDGIRNIHPRNKWDVGRRLALWALAKDYGHDDLVCSGPLYKSMEVKGAQVVLAFDYVGGGLASRPSAGSGRPEALEGRDGGVLEWFTIAGKDGKFVPAQARIARSQGAKVDDIVIVSSPQVAEPTAVRFAWGRTAIPNFINREGLPASPFTTESFEELTKQGG